jgi:hypothetical protein
MEVGDNGMGRTGDRFREERLNGACEGGRCIMATLVLLVARRRIA